MAYVMNIRPVMTTVSIQDTGAGKLKQENFEDLSTTDDDGSDDLGKGNGNIWDAWD